MKTKKLLILFSLVLFIFLLCISPMLLSERQSALEKYQTTADLTGISSADPNDIFIVYTNDIHSYIYNTSKDETQPVLRLSNVAALAKDLQDAGYSTLLVDAGDAIQGTTYGSVDNGKSVIRLMNSAGYDFAVPGNHEYDYGAGYFVNLAREDATFPYVSCDFFNYPDITLVFPAYRIYNLNGVKVGFVGISTPESRISSTPKHFNDSQGNLRYTFSGLENLRSFYQNVQFAINVVKERCDYVIGVGHLGIGMESQRLGYSSLDVIANTTGLDVLIDGHSHSVVEGEMIRDLSGKEVLLTQTGCSLKNVGLLSLSKNHAPVSKLLSEYPRSEGAVAILEDSIYDTVNDIMGKTVATLGSTLYINDPEKPDRRLIRSHEMNSGDFVADAFYWYFNDYLESPCDVVLQNSGGVRAQLPQGAITYMDVKNLQPFGNQLCIVKVTGQNLLDALETGTTVIGEWDSEWDSPAENAALMQVAGVQYTIDSSVPTSVVFDDAKNFLRVDGEYRVKDVKVYNRETGSYDPLELDKYYTIGGVSHVVHDGGDGLTMFSKAELVLDYVSMDYDVVIDYLRTFPSRNDLPFISSEGSPLCHYEGYSIAYENPFGAGRFTILEK